MALVTSALSAESNKPSGVNFLVYDIDADHPVARTQVEVAVNSNCASGQETRRFSAATGENGEFEASLPIGEHLLTVTAPFSAPVAKCVDIASAQQIKRCTGGFRMNGPFIPQTFIVRSVKPSSKCPSDVLNSHPCDQVVKSVCFPLNLPNTISSNYVLFTNEESRPLASVILEFRRVSMGVGELLGSVTTNSDGGADLSPIYALPLGKGLVNVKIAESSSNEGLQGGFQLDLRPTSSGSSQRVKILKWRCHGREQLAATTE